MTRPPGTPVLDLPSTGRAPAPSPACAGLVLRSALLGVAAGGRSSLGVAAPLLARATTGARPAGAAGAALAVLAVAGELAADKLPAMPSRFNGVSLPARLLSGLAGGALLARREGSRTLRPALAGAAGALAGASAGVRWRSWASRGGTDLPGALVEDTAAVVLALLSTRNRRRG